MLFLCHGMRGWAAQRHRHRGLRSIFVLLYMQLNHLVCCVIVSVYVCSHNSFRCSISYRGHVLIFLLFLMLMSFRRIQLICSTMNC